MIGRAYHKDLKDVFENIFPQVYIGYEVVVTTRDDQSRR